jgi:hypothetical protein
VTPFNDHRIVLNEMEETPYFGLGAPTINGPKIWVRTLPAGRSGKSSSAIGSVLARLDGEIVIGENIRDMSQK